MTTCIECTHWNTKGTDRAMVRLGFAACALKKLTGHTVSAEAQACERFDPLEAKAAAARREWLGKQLGEARQ